jgi:hypothetical protein
METYKNLWPKLATLLFLLMVLLITISACKPEMVYVEDETPTSTQPSMVIQHDLFTETDGTYTYTCLVSWRDSPALLAQSCWRD